MMEIDELLEIADRAARHVLHYGSWRAEDWDDAIQEAMVDLVVLQDRPSAYAFRVAVYRIRDWMRREYRDRAVFACYLNPDLSLSPAHHERAPSFFTTERQEDILGRIRCTSQSNRPLSGVWRRDIDLAVVVGYTSALSYSLLPRVCSLATITSVSRWNYRWT